MQSGTRPPVSSFALTQMSGSTPRNDAAEKRPRRYNPVKTSSKITGRPVHCGPCDVGDVIVEVRRTTSTRARWKRGSLKGQYNFNTKT